MKILLVGISVRAMVESAVRSGYSVVALDAFGDQDLRALTESHSLHCDFDSTYSARALFNASQSFDFDAVAYTSNLENHPKILSQIEAKTRVLGNLSEAVKSVRHWPALFGNLKRAGFSVPDTVFSGEAREIDHSRKWLTKPILSGGGHGIKFVIPGTQYSFQQAAVCRKKYCVPGIAPGFMLQEYVPGKACSASFVSNGHECAILGITEQLIGLHEFGSRKFRYCGNILPLPELLDPMMGSNIFKQLNSLAAFLTQEYGLTGVNGVDFILNGDRVYLTEVNPRYSASMELIERAYTLPIFHLHTQSVLDGSIPEFNLQTSLKRRKFLGKAILFAERDAAAPDTGGWRAKDIHDIPESGEKIPAGLPICTILAAGSAYNETLADLTDRALALKEEIYGKTDCDSDYGAFHQAGERDFDWKGTDGISGSHERY